jgi:hypothetical protein
MSKKIKLILLCVVLFGFLSGIFCQTEGNVYQIQLTFGEVFGAAAGGFIGSFLLSFADSFFFPRLSNRTFSQIGGVFFLSMGTGVSFASIWRGSNFFLAGFVFAAVGIGVLTGASFASRLKPHPSHFKN